MLSRTLEPAVSRPRLTGMQRSRGMSWALIAMTVAAGLATAACGTRPAPTGPAASRTVTSVTAASRGGPPQGSRAASLVLAGRMLRQLRRPPGSRVITPRPVPKNLRGPVTITRTSASGRRTARTFRSRSALARLARVLNSRPASDGGSSSCPSGSSSYRLVFRPAVHHPRFVVTALGCATDSVTVAGRDQPVLWDPHERVIAATRRLLSARAR